MKKYLVAFEFRYEGLNKSGDDYTYNNPKVTIGIYDTIEEAIKYGNESLTELEKTFDVRGDRFQLKFLFGSPKTLVTNTCTKDRVHFFGKITTLDFKPLNDMVKESLKARKEYDNWKKLND